MNEPSELGALLAARLRSTAALLDLVRADEHLLAETVRAAEQTATAIQAGGTLFICGNGGSAGEATHLSGELIGPFLDKRRRPLPAIALGFDTSAATAVANDFSFAEVFARQLEALARPGDVLWALSTSGRSPNVAMALEVGPAAGPDPRPNHRRKRQGADGPGRDRPRRPLLRDPAHPGDPPDAGALPVRGGGGHRRLDPDSSA